ncbi:MAG: DHA2 family efflux MFS transporter permease subunit [Clostridia bacterium]|nr:DHA2 family efflux MFS transporter permease subunit [Clostridia bacterium]
MNTKVNSKGVFVVLVLGAIITALVSTVMSTALPAIMAEFVIPASQAQLVTSIYSLVSGVMILATAVIIKKFKTRRLFLTGMFLFSIGVLLCAICPTYGVMLAGRVVQGVGYGIIISLTQVVILTIVPEGRRGFAMGIYGFAVVLAPILGPILGGLVIDHYSWRLIFWIILLICAVDIILGLIFMRNVLENTPQRFDVPSMILAAVGFTGVVLGTGNIGTYPFLSVQTGLLLLVGVAALVVFALRQMKLENPLLNLRVFTERDFTVAVIMSVILYGTMNAMPTIMPILVQTIMGHSATMFGIIIAPCSVLMAVLSPFTGKLFDKIGMRPLALIGCVLATISNACILFVRRDSPVILLIAILIVFGIGMAFVVMNLVTFGMEKLEGAKKTDGTALITCLRTMGSALGTAGFVALMSVGTTAGQYTVENVHHSYIGMTVCTAITVIIVIVFIRGKKKDEKNKLPAPETPIESEGENE